MYSKAFFHLFFLHLSFSNVATTANGTGGRESVFFSLLNGEHSSDPRILGLVRRRLGVKSLWCGVLFAGTRPSY